MKTIKKRTKCSFLYGLDIEAENMIFDKIENANLYLGLSNQMDTALEYLKSFDFASHDYDRIELDNGVFSKLILCIEKPLENTVWEYHRKYIDIQVISEEGEKLCVAPVDTITGWNDYSSERDVSISSDTSIGVVLTMKKEYFAVFFPTDAHRTCWGDDDVKGKQIKKLVIKIPI